jgi:phage RecT family recombinase
MPEKPLASNAMVVRRELQANESGAADRLRDILQGDPRAKDRWMELAFAMLKRPDLAECKRGSLYAAVKSAAVLNLELDGELGHGCIIPYKGEAKFIAGYRGKIVLADRAGFDVDAAVVYAGDHFPPPERGLHPKLEHVPEPDRAKRGKRIAAYVVFTNKATGTKKFWVTDAEKIEAIKKDAPSARSSHSPWNHAEHSDWMWIKTAIGQGMKLLPLSPTAMRAVIYDEYNDAGVGQAETPRSGRRPFGFGAKRVDAEDVTQSEGRDNHEARASTPAGSAAGVSHSAPVDMTSGAGSAERDRAARNPAPEDGLPPDEEIEQSERAYRESRGGDGEL